MKNQGRKNGQNEVFMFIVWIQPHNSTFLQSPGCEKLISCALDNSDIVVSGLNLIVSIKEQYVARRGCLPKKKKKTSKIILKILLFFNKVPF